MNFWPCKSLLCYIFFVWKCIVLTQINGSLVTIKCEIYASDHFFTVLSEAFILRSIFYGRTLDASQKLKARLFKDIDPSRTSEIVLYVMYIFGDLISCRKVLSEYFAFDDLRFHNGSQDRSVGRFFCIDSVGSGSNPPSAKLSLIVRRVASPL